MVRAGEPRKIEITLDRGSEFAHTVVLTVAPPPGLTAELPKAITPADPGAIPLTVTAGSDTPAGSYTVVVTATSPDGMWHSAKVLVTVARAE